MSFTYFLNDSHERKLLHDNWKLSIGNSSSKNIANIKAQVPGCVHTDLMKNDLIDDPFYSMNELDVKWVAEEDWVYETTINIALNRNPYSRNQLVFEGLDTVAEIYLDDSLIGNTNNMFVSHRIDFPLDIQDGNHILKIVFYSPMKAMNERVKKWGRVRSSLDDDRGWVRKAQYSYGWDWGPSLPTSGIWRPVYFQKWDTGRISWFNYDFKHDGKIGLLDISVAYTTEIEKELKVSGIISLDDVELKAESTICKSHGGNETLVHLQYKIENPKLWWPHDLGEPNLYKLQLDLTNDHEIIHSINDKIGLREVKLIEEKDEVGRSFKFRINGRDTFAKGANWIPTDSFIPRSEEDRYYKQISLAKTANMNMLRVWGGGIYEDDAFYRAADELGLMVWQDFPYACAFYPDTPEFLIEVREESRKAVNQISKHPSIVFWCGNNEIERDSKDFQRNWDTRYQGETIWKQIIPTVIKEEFPSAIYRQSSPDGPDGPNSPYSGDRHVWNVWSGWQEEEGYIGETGRFISEFGFQSPPDPKTIKDVLPDGSQWPQSKEFEWHNKQINGPERLFRFMAGKYRITEDFDDFIRKSQAVQASALETALEHWRRLRPVMMGSLIWQLNDCWPVSSWSLIDYTLRPKASFYHVKRAFQPKLLTLIKNADKLEIWCVNESNDVWEDEISVKRISTDGEVSKSVKMSLRVEVDQSILLETLAINEWIEDQYKDVLVFESKGTSEYHIRKMWYSNPEKHMKFVKPEIDLKPECKNGMKGVSVSSKGVAVSIWLYDKNIPDVFFEDNALNLLPGETRWIRTTEINSGEDIALKEPSYWSFVD